jgi:hypothetical protein
MLQEFGHLMEETKEFSPPREFDHRIPMKEGAMPVNVRSYRYTRFQKWEKYILPPKLSTHLHFYLKCLKRDT